MLKFLDDHLEEYIAFVLWMIMLVVLITQVILRYFFSKGLIWSDEVARYSFQWVIYLGISMAMKEDQHIRVDAVLTLWPSKLRKSISILSDLCVLGLGLYLVYGGYRYTARIFRQGSMGMAFPILLGFVYIAVPVGYLLMCARTCQKTWCRLKNVS